MSKISVKAEIPAKSPDELINISSKVVARDSELGDKSPVRVLDMVTFKTKLQSAIDKRAQAKKLHDQAEVLNQEAGLELGIDNSQSSKTSGTVYSTLTSIRDILLGVYKGQEDKLGEWGFNAVSSTVTKSKNGGAAK